jgi:hypothetical protein
VLSTVNFLKALYIGLVYCLANKDYESKKLAFKFLINQVSPVSCSDLKFIDPMSYNLWGTENPNWDGVINISWCQQYSHWLPLKWSASMYLLLCLILYCSLYNWACALVAIYDSYGLWGGKLWTSACFSGVWETQSFICSFIKQS